jgi:hypothetical protein
LRRTAIGFLIFMTPLAVSVVASGQQMVRSAGEHLRAAPQDFLHLNVFSVALAGWAVVLAFRLKPLWDRLAFLLR